MDYRGGEPVGAGSTQPGDTSETYSLIDAHSALDGTLSTARDLLVEGQLTGAIRCEGTLYVAEGASIDATVEAGGIVVSGQLSGSVRCSGRLEIRETGVVRARIDTARLIIHEGAVYEGHINMELDPDAGTPEEPAGATPPAVDRGEPAGETPGSTTTSYQFLRTFTGSGSGDAGDDDLPGGDADDDERG